MPQTELTPELLAGAAGALLSLLFSYLPGLAGWYQRLNGETKRLVMLAALLAVSAGTLAISCLGFSEPLLSGIAPPPCSQPGALALLRTLTLALVANQAVFLIAPRRTE